MDEDPPREPDDALLRRAQAGDKSGLGELFERHREWIYATSLKRLSRLPRRVAASDCVQEVFLELLRSLDVDSSIESAKAWIEGVVNHVILRMLEFHWTTQQRSLKREQDVPEQRRDIASAQRSPSGELCEREKQQRLDRCIAQLPEPHRLIFRLYVWAGLTFREIGLLLDRSESGARTKYVEASQLLMDMQNPEDPSP